jgi:hypothetical protein
MTENRGGERFRAAAGKDCRAIIGSIWRGPKPEAA